METELGWKEAIVKVLSDAKKPMHYVDIGKQIFEDGLREQGETATPGASVAAIIAQSFSNDGANSPFVRVARGIYALRSGESTSPQIAQAELAETESSDITGVINAFGMFWDRLKVKWESDPRILGQQQAGAKAVDFCAQKGVYLLHDSQGVVYVGRTTSKPR
jgi:hypothetical protein